MWSYSFPIQLSFGSDVDRSQVVNNKNKGRLLFFGSNKNPSIIPNRRYHIFVTRVSVNIDDECGAQSN